MDPEEAELFEKLKEWELSEEESAEIEVALLYGVILERKNCAWLETLWAVSKELELGVYNGEALARRLQAWERKGRYAPSIIYSLLRRSAEAYSDTQSAAMS